MQLTRFQPNKGCGVNSAWNLEVEEQLEYMYRLFFFVLRMDKYLEKMLVE